jgi:hypothetical protein
VRGADRKGEPADAADPLLEPEVDDPPDGAGVIEPEQ